MYRPLNVKDALSYLDQVKMQFYSQADVYNNFLDIMKDFKSQSIDTPGVIDRVSSLFRGHPNLIQGFNTFLPPGYRIECSLDPSDPNPITVTTPLGETTRPNNLTDASALNNVTWREGAQQQQQQPPQQQQPQSQAPQQPQSQQAPPQLASQVQGSFPQETAPGVAQPGAASGNPAGHQLEFNHAILYVNKIKTRFANQPDIYKQFLEILQTYQREQKPIGEVYEQVTQLFVNSPDLLDDFKRFLPDSANLQQHFDGRDENQLLVSSNHALNGSHHNQNGMGAAPGEVGYYGGNASQLPPLGNFQPATGAAVTAEQQRAYAYSTAQEAEHNKDVALRKGSEHYEYEHNYNDEAQYLSLRGAVQPVPLNSQQHPHQVQTNGKPYKGGASAIGTGAVGSGVAGGRTANATLVPGIPEPVPPCAMAKTSTLTEELAFFDKVKRAIGNKQTYNEFLKMLNLFSQDIIDKDTLVERVDVFLGDAHADLLSWFKQFVGYEEKTQHIEDITFKKHQIELSLCKAYGPSYRQLPKVETYMPCSGRDEMCWEVLNDEWVGHPTWASEDSGFISHRKNQYEEILFKIEEERLEFDYHMEANLRTIQTLETIANRIANMTPEQKANFKVPPGLGHTLQTIYKKVIRKIYDKDRGFEVIDALHENPAVAVPVVLKRLKQKDEEWKRAQREWNKVWREMEQKVFYKSLDHLGLTFKQADKKLLTAKQMVSEISTVKMEQQNKRLHPLTPKPQEQLNYEFKEQEVIFDILRLSEFYIHHSSSYSAGDRDKLGAFFKHFIGLLFGISGEDIDVGLAARLKDSAEVVDKSENGSANGLSTTQVTSGGNGSSSGSNGSSDHVSKKRHRDTDLLRDVLKKQSKSRKEEMGDSPAASENEDSELHVESEKPGDFWIQAASLKFSLEDVRLEKKRDRFNLFCNTTIYVFVRHFRTLYQRLLEIKLMDKDVRKEIALRKLPQFAKDLNLVLHQLEDLGVEILSSKSAYAQVLALAERLLDGEIEHQWFEESLRQAYRNKAYKCYTLDKVVQSMVKYMHTMITDSKTSEMLFLYEQDRKSPHTTAKDQILYRMQVRSLMNTEENMFKVAFVELTDSMNIQFVGLDDLTINDHANAEEMYNYYVTSYVMSHPTEGVPISKINMPFQKSFIQAIDEDQCDGVSVSELRVSLCENSYRLFFEKNTFDEFTAKSVYTKLKDAVVATREEKLEQLELVLMLAVPWAGTSSEATSAKLESNFQTLLNEGAATYKRAKADLEDEPMEDVEREDEAKKQHESADATSAGDEQDATKDDKNASLSTSSFKVNPDATIDADSTVVQEHNDTTIQQDANDTTMDDATDAGSFNM